jgi:hypothetical protein
LEIRDKKSLVALKTVSHGDGCMVKVKKVECIDRQKGKYPVEPQRGNNGLYRSQKRWKRWDLELR